MGKPSGAQHVGNLPDGRSIVRLVCEALPVNIAPDPLDASAPAQQWIQVCPLGPFVEAVDGRTFQVSDPLGVAANSELPLLIDRDHISESWMGDTEAQGWVEELRVQMTDDGEFPNAGIWGRAEWTPDGHGLVTSKKFRFISPVLILDGETRDAKCMTSVALTNRPALSMQGLDAYRQRFNAQPGQLQGARTMKPETLKLLLAALALADGATDEQITAAFQARLTSDPGKEQRELLSQQLGEANRKIATLEAKAAESTKAAFAAEVTAVLDQASKDGKVPPAARAGYEAMCRTPEMFATFKDSILPNLVSICGPAPRSAAAIGDVVATHSASPDVTARLKHSGLDDKRIQEAQAYRAQQRDVRNQRAANGEG
jgi:hypothetical protein